MKNLLKQSMKPTVIITLISAILSVLLLLVLVYLERHANARYLAVCLNVSYCAVRSSVAMEFVQFVVSDLSTLARYISELGVVVIIAQLIYRAAKRS